MLHLILSRLLQLPLILVVIFLLTFTLAWVVPGNPLDRADGRRPSPQIQEAIERQYNLHSPTAFLASYVTDALQGDFGPSLHYQQRVSDIIARGLPVSMALGVGAIVVALILGTLAGVVGALWPGTALDLSSMALTLIGISLPSFIIGSILLAFFAGLLHLLPAGGWGSRPDQILLPALTLGIAPAAYIARLIRLGLADVMSSDHVRTALAKGLSRRAALFKHALKMAYLPVLSFLGPAAAAAMTGSFVVEKIFNIPGLGEHFVAAAINKDPFLILGVVMTYSVMLILFNLLVDVAYAWLDPRIAL